MNNNKRLIKDNRHLLYVLTVIAAMLSLYTLPRQRVQRFSFTTGKPWTYPAIIAPFNYSVEKDPMLFQAETDSVTAHFSPYFTFREESGADALRDFDRLCRDSLGTFVSAQTIRTVRNRLIRVYERGILPSQDEGVLEGRTRLSITRGNVARTTVIDSLYSVAQAYRYITQAPMGTHERTLLLSLHLEEFVRPNLTYDRQHSEKALDDMKSQISRYSGMVLAGQKIIDQGEVVDADRTMAIKSYLDIANDRVKTHRFQALTWIGQAILVILSFLALMLYLILFRPKYIEQRSSMYFLYSFITLFVVGIGLYVKYLPWNVMLVPCTILAIAMRIFLDTRTSFCGFLVFVTVTSTCVPIPYEYILMQIGAGIISVFSLHELSQRSQILRTCLYIFLSYSIIWLALRMLNIDDLAGIDPKFFLMTAINSTLVMLVYPLLFIIEKTFGFTSNVTLIELSNINNPLLRELAEKAPGTFQHSMQVSALAAEAASAIGAESQLVRTAALYHDIGKIESAPFFTENQNGVNPHDRLSPQQSARIITDHVDAGLMLAEKHGLPTAIQHFIATHHGNGMAKYFYLKYKQEHPDTEPDTETFSYPGPNPDTRETAILMMADAAEAASRSLKEYTEESIGEMVEKIIGSQISEGYFSDCPISWKEIGQIKNVFKEKLRVMYHTRISYPDPDDSPMKDQHHRKH